MKLPRARINLLQSDLVIATRYKSLQKLSLVAVAAYVFVISALFVYFFLLINQRAGLETSREGLLRDVQALRDTEGLLVTLKDRIGLSREIFAAAAPAPAEILQEQIGLLPSGVEVVSLAFKEDGNLSMSLRASGSLSVAQFMESLKTKEYSSVVLNSLTLLEGGAYSVSVTFK